MRYFYLIFLSSSLILIGCGKSNSSRTANHTQEQDRGGGNFTVPLFWEKALSEIKPELESLEDETVLYKDDLARLLNLIDKNAVQVTMTDNQLYITKDSKQTPVDAINYPSQKLIELYRPAWTEMVKQGYDINHLILHEFLGLAKINDQNYKVSAVILPPKKLKISFDSNQISCQIAGKFLLRGEKNWIIRDMPTSEAVVTTFLSPRVVGQKECAGKVSKTSECSRYVNDVLIKAVSVELPLITDTSGQPDSKYYVIADIQLVSSYYHFGYGGAQNMTFYRPPQLHIVWRLVEKESNGKIIPLSLIQSSTSDTDNESDTASIDEDIPVSSFAEKLAQNGYPLKLAPYSGEMSNMFHSYNIAGFLEQTAMDQGLTKSEEINNYIANTVLKGFPKAMPFRASVGCQLLAPDIHDK